MHRSLLAAAAVTVALLGPGTSVAQPAPAPSPTPTPPAPSASTAPGATAAPSATTAPSAAASAEEEAGRTFQLGREAFKAEDYARALEQFKKSQALQASPGTLLNIALAEEKLGLAASAWRDFQRVVEQFTADDDRVPIAKDGAIRTAPRVPWLKIERAAGAPPTLAIKVDGAPLAANLVGAEQPLDPGPHVVTTLVTGFEERRYDVTLTEGQHLPLVVEPGKRTMVAVPVGPGEKASGGASLMPRLAAVGLVGAGLAGLGTGIATGVLALSKKSELETACPNPPACDAGGRRLEGEARTLAGISTGTLIFGGIATAAGVAIFFTVGDGKSALVSASPTPGGGFLSATGRF